MKRWYVTMIWDDWPEGGSYWTIVKAEDSGEAESMVRRLMAVSRTCGFQPGDREHDPQYWIDYYGDRWHTVDCFDLDEFIERHQPRMIAAI